MRRLLSFFIKNSLFGDVLTVAIIVLGAASLFLIRREVFPNVDFDVLSVTTIFQGASPEEVERLVTNPLEQDLKEVDGIKKLQSFSVEGRSLLTIWLDPDQTSSDKAKEDVSSVIDRWVLPAGVDKPLLQVEESKLAPLIQVSLSGDMPDLELRTVARKLEREIELLPGVAKVAPIGMEDLEIRVEADSKKLKQYYLTLEDVIRGLKSENQSVPGGIIEGTEERFIRTVGSFETVEDVENSVVRANEMARPIRIKEIATVKLAPERSTILSYTNGRKSINLTVLKKETADAIELVETVKARVDELKPQLDPRLKVDFIQDFSKFIKRRLSILTSNLLVGLGLVLILLPFIMPFKYSLLIALGEPFAFLGAILVLYLTGNTINLISMIGLIIVSGILVDDSIVVTENAARLIGNGMKPEQAAIKGTRQIMGPVTASVCTTAMAFLPLALMSGIFGKFIREIPIAVLTALAVSLFETLFILPAHVAHWISPQTHIKNLKKREGFLARAAGRSHRFWDERVVPTYRRWLAFTLRFRYWVAFSFVVLFVGSMAFGFGVMRFVLFPPEGVEQFFVRLEAPVGISLDAHRDRMRPIEEVVAKLPKEEVESFTTAIGIHQQDANDPLTKLGTEYSQINVALTPERERERDAAAIIEDLRKQLGKPEGFRTLNFARVNPGPPVGKPVSLSVRAERYEDILPAVKKLKEELTKIPGVTDIEDSYVLGKKEVGLSVDRAEASAAGVSVESIGQIVRASFGGAVATSIRNLDEEIKVRVSLSEKERSTPDTLSQIFVPNGQGALIPLDRVTKREYSQKLALYQHEDNRREVKVAAEVNTDVTSARQVNDKLRTLLKSWNAEFPKVHIVFGGEEEDTEESMASLGRAFLMAIVGIFLILILTFRKLLQPLLVMLTIPMGMIAVVWAFFFHGMPLSFLGMLGVVALSGIIVNNAIVFIDFVNQLRAEGLDSRQSILDAAAIRLRPIFLTTVTTILGVMPTAYGIGGLDKFVVPIAMALGWGLMFGSLLTAFVFPSALAILDDVSALFSRSRPRAERAS